ncbi:UNVERIFIED_CONTAM: hypothetical protein NY100_34530, partial [Prevotella sp. 15_C9]
VNSTNGSGFLLYYYEQRDFASRLIKHKTSDETLSLQCGEKTHRHRLVVFLFLAEVGEYLCQIILVVNIHKMLVLLP